MKIIASAIAELREQVKQRELAIKALRHLDAFAVANNVNGRKQKRTVSAASRAKMRAAQRARWARIRAAAKPKLIKGKVA